MKLDALMESVGTLILSGQSPRKSTKLTVETLLLLHNSIVRARLMGLEHHRAGRFCDFCEFAKPASVNPE